MSENTEVAVPEETPLPGYLSGASWTELTTGADEVFGGELEKAESLIGVPFVLLRATFRIGDYARPDGQGMGDYCSLDLITATPEIIESRIKRGRIPNPEMHAEPSSHLVLNVSGTGAYRQVVSYLEARAYIVLPDGPEGGEYGASRLDTPVRSWGIGQSARVRFDEESAYESAEFDLRLHCPRGLRASEFDNEKAKDISVYYLA